jgi:alginate O-acetyltransferase complex protein AlgJ
MEPPERRLSREEIAKREIGRTDISPTLARFMVAVFLATIAAVPAIQTIQEVLLDGRNAKNSRRQNWYAIASAFDGISESYRKAEGGRFAKIVAANDRLLSNIHEYERRLEDESFLTRALLGPTQYWLARLGGLGNEMAYLGLDRWLFYRPGVDYVTGSGFLEPVALARRTAGGNEYTIPPQPDPRPAILEFQEQLSRSGVALVLMPTPDKSMVEPERFSPRYREPLESLQNPSFDRFAASMESAGVVIFDPTPVLLEHKRKTGRPQFLATDTHWTPDAMQAVAERLSEFIAEHAALPTRPARGYRSRAVSARNLGDIAVMMVLPSGQDLFPEQEVTVRQVLRPDGELWTPSADADILLLGDSFTNIYSMTEMNWGQAAGLAEQLSFTMDRSIDRIAQNDAGASATRQALALELGRGNDRLAGKRVLVWQFAMRELAVGDWKRLPYHASHPTATGRSSGPATAGAGREAVRGRIKAVSSVPQPGSVPYRHAIVAVHLTEVQSLRGPIDRPEIVVYLWGLRDNRITSAARYRPGQTVTLHLTSWQQAQERYGRYNRVELDDPEFQLIELPTYWGEEIP